MAVLLQWLGVVVFFAVGLVAGYWWVRSAVLAAVDHEELRLRRDHARGRAAQDREAARRLEAVAEAHRAEAEARRRAAVHRKGADARGDGHA